MYCDNAKNLAVTSLFGKNKHKRHRLGYRVPTAHDRNRSPNGLHNIDKKIFRLFMNYLMGELIVSSQDAQTDIMLLHKRITHNKYM